jgi:hypothetical protein
MWLATNLIAALAALPRAVGFEARLLSFMIAGRGTTTVQCWLSTSELTIERDKRGMLVSRTRTV